MTWQPLLEGGLKDRALDSVRALLDDLQRPEREPDADPSLAGGTAGRAVLHSYLAQSQGGQEHAAAAARWLECATAAVADQPAPASLYRGLAGVGWAIAHLHGRLPGPDGAEDA